MAARELRAGCADRRAPTEPPPWPPESSAWAASMAVENLCAGVREARGRWEAAGASGEGRRRRRQRAQAATRGGAAWGDQCEAEAEGDRGVNG
jgi:hypothetical protein